jgi:hypothetical protein
MWISDRIVVTADVDPVLTAGVTCHGCNGGWIKAIDDAAAAILKPLIRSDHAVEMSSEEQTIVAAWIFKTVLICDAAQRGEETDLSPLRSQFCRESIAPPGCVIMVGPAPPAIAGKHRPFGLLPLRGNIHIKVIGADGTESPGADVPIPGWRVMMGALDAILGGSCRRPWSLHLLRVSYRSGRHLTPSRSTLDARLGRARCTASSADIPRPRTSTSFLSGC